MSQTFVPSSYSGLAADGDLYSGIGTEFSGLGADDAYGGWFSDVRKKSKARRKKRRSKRKTKSWLKTQRDKVKRSREAWREERGWSGLELVPYGALGFDDAYGAVGSDDAYGGWLSRQASRVTRWRKGWRENRAERHMTRYKEKGCDKDPEKTGCGHKKKWAERHLAKAEELEAKMAARGHATEIGLSETGEVVQEYSVHSKRVGKLASGERLSRRRKGKKGKKGKGKKGKGKKGKGGRLAAASSDPGAASAVAYSTEEPSNLPLILGGVVLVGLAGGLLYTFMGKKKE